MTAQFLLKLGYDGSQPPTRESVRIFLESQGYEYLGTSLPEDSPEYEPPPPDGTWVVAFVEAGPFVGLYRVRERAN